jgi:hypothetical protein
MKGAYSGTVTLQLVGTSSGTVYASKNITVNSNAGSFTYYETTYPATQSPDGNNVWKLTFDGSKVAGGALWFDLVQLFPVTYHQRYAQFSTIPALSSINIDIMAFEMMWVTSSRPSVARSYAFQAETTCTHPFF